ncbi:mitogen-activated protein kinase-binding protein 1-like [Sergentomyia squamirostris]
MFAPRNSSPNQVFNNEDVAAYQIKLKKVLGLTVCSNAALDVSPTSGILAYPAGCTVVLLNAKKLSQTYLLNTSRKAITAVAFSQCGRYVATGECGINPAIKVWELDPLNGNLENGVTGGNVVAEFLGHKYAVSCVAFSPTGKYLVSVGSQHDMIVNVFDWKLNLKIASNKVSAKVVAVAFSEDGSYFVTVGNRHVKFWYLEGNRKYKEPIPLMGRSAILGDLRNNDFCAVACGKGEMFESTYAITRNGQLVEFNSRRLLDKWVACRTTSANCLSVGSRYILVGCAEAIVRCFNAETLEYVTTLPRTHYLGVDVAQGVQLTHMMSAPQNAKYPDTIALVFDEVRSKATCVYNDHSLYVWDLRDVRRVGKSHSFLYHSACIWGVETVPFTCVKNNLTHNLPLDCFLTCSSDDTIRVWDLDGCDNNNEIYRKNIYSKDLLKIAYIDEEMNFIKDMDNPILNNEKNSTYDGRNGVRCIKISTERNHLATGDRSGNVRIYNLTNLKLLTTIEAHDSEVLCLEYTNDRIERKLLGSASRDRLIHIFDVEQGYKILQTLDDHSSSITSIKFIGFDMNFQMISCGADKAIIFRTFQNNQFQRGNNCNGKNTLYDMEVDSNSKHILTACQDRNIRVYGSQTAKHTKTFKGSHSDEGSLIKLTLDSSGIYIATSCTDKTLSVYDYYSNECMARMYGHSELVTGLKFTNDCRHLISASGDGCVFVWQVPHDMVVTMQARLSQQALRSGQQIPIPRPIAQNVTELVLEPQHQPQSEKPELPSFTEDVVISGGYKLSDVGQLPMWAKRKTDEPNTANILGTSPSQNTGIAAPKPRGRWAQRSQYEPEMDLRNIVDSPPNSSTNNNNPSSDYNSSSSKDVYINTYLSEDSSIDSGLENRRMKVTEKNLNSLNSESNTEHDGDVEDISDGERTSSDHGVLFYPTGAPGTPSDFKVNETNVEELRKSMRRKTDKQRLQLSQSPSAPSTGTGTGTSDEEDEASTPSGDNADRSLASTLGGSMESIPQATNSFLNAAIDGPSNVSEKGRNSLSAIHNSGDSKPVTISKSFTNTKKEELMKIIKDAKQKLENAHNSHKNDRQNSKGGEVGYRRSNLRASQSISDLSQVSKSNLDPNSRLTRPIRPEQELTNTSNNKSTNAYQCNNFFNCAAPRAVLAQNCNIVRQVQRDLPPFPHSVGAWVDDGRPRVLELVPQKIPSSSGGGQLLSVGGGMSSGILKNKSAPVSPVNEELEWAAVGGKNVAFYGGGAQKRGHSVCSEDAKVIFEMINSDTRRMIDEITEEYGDDGKFTAKKEKNEHGFLSEDEGSISSDSLEECSLNNPGGSGMRKRKIKKTVCAKHSRKPPVRSVSDYFIYDEFGNFRQVFKDEDPNQFLETQRHSSASFFLGQQYPEKKSQESIISDETSAGISYCNSMESILSDDSECKSAPLEVLFNKSRGRFHQYQATGLEIDPTSKSYGSSPNATTGFDYFMQHRELDIFPEEEDFNPRMTSSISVPQFMSNPFGPYEELDFIPSMNAKFSNPVVNKSLSKEFAHERQQNNSNPLFGCDGTELFVRKPIPPSRRPPPPPPLECFVRKSCSFEIDMGDCRRTEKSFRKFEANLQKFERDRHLFRLGDPLQMDYVPHKPPVANRRSTSMKTRGKTKAKDKFNTFSLIERKQELLKAEAPLEERSFDIFFTEPPVMDDDNFDSLEMEANSTKVYKENSVDSLDDILEVNADKPRHMDFRNSAQYTKFRDIEKKIDVINKLVEMEEHKLEQERVAKEARLKPFSCDRRQKGYVKSLTMNFDRLAQRQTNREFERDFEIKNRMRRNYSLPDVLESAKYQSFQVIDCPPEKDNEHHNIKHFRSDYKPMNAKPVPSARTNVPASRTAAKRNAGVSVKLDPATAGMGTRSVSMGILNQASDSEPESARGGVMKPTISSQNKINTVSSSSGRIGNKGGAFGTSRRRGMQNSYSSINLTQAGQDDSSSEETTVVAAIPSGKPAVPPRPRNLSADHKRSNLKQNNLNDTEVPCKDNDNSDVAQCSRLINQLMFTTNSVVQLHARLTQTEGATGNTYMLQELENAVVMTQNMLTKVTNTKNNKDSSSNSFSAGQQSQHINRLENGDYVQMREKCNDMLNKVQNINNSS